MGWNTVIRLPEGDKIAVVGAFDVAVAVAFTVAIANTCRRLISCACAIELILNRLDFILPEADEVIRVDNAIAILLLVFFLVAVEQYPIAAEIYAFLLSSCV